MATAPIHLEIPNVTTAALLRGMLATCETRTDLTVWKQDFTEHVHLISYADRMDMIGKASARMCRIAGGVAQ